jgi:hypothetical protein
MITIIVFLSAFKILESDEWFLEALPGIIGLLQKLGNPLVLLIMFISIFKVSLNKKFYFRKNTSGLFYYFIFSILVILFGKPIAYDKLIGLTVIFFYFLYVVPELFFFHKNKECIVKAFSNALIAITLFNLFLYIKYPLSVVWKGRLFGTPYHPNFMGLILAINICLSFYLLSINRKQAKLIIIHIINIIISFFLCYNTGSRTSLGLAVISIIIISFFRIRTLSSKVLITGIGILLLLLFVENLSAEKLDYAGRGNTREEAWSIMLEQALEFPVIGTGKTGWTANSYLFSIIASGVFGAVFLYLSILKSIQNIKLKTSYDSKIIYQTLLILLLLGAIMEGYLLDTISVPIIVYWFLLAYPLSKKII